MYCTELKIRVRYSEADRMGYCYYGNYAQFFEVARVEALRSLGVVYKDLEDDGILLPVVDFNINYMQPAHYDDELTIKCTISEMPSVKINFTYETYKDQTLLNKGYTGLVFVDKQLQKPTRPPAHILEKFKPHFN